MVQENQRKKFALIDQDQLEFKTIIDTQAAVSKIKSCKSYQSVQEIIELAIKEGFPLKKNIYKVQKPKKRSSG
jgi:hypothetical protein